MPQNISFQINNKLGRMREFRINTLTENIKRWDANTDEITELVMWLEELGSLQQKTGTVDYTILSFINHPMKYQKQIKSIIKCLQDTGDGNLIICDKNGFCICDLDQGNPLDIAGDNDTITVEHIDELIDSYVSEVTYSNRATNMKNIGYSNGN